MQDPNLLVGFSTGDDAAVYRLTDDLCVIQTVDFFPPIVDDPHDFGVIAAVNAFSDVYAMGGKPILALNIVCFPENLDLKILGRILEGGADAAKEAGVLIAGGHTVKDAEPKYGMAVTGLIAPDKIVTNANAKPGDKLVLTKPIGTGIISTAAKADVTDADIVAGAVGLMRQSNRAGSEAMLEIGVNSGTDVTGFGLIGHLTGMMKASGTTARISLGAVPLIPGTRELAGRGIIPGGTRRNLDAARADVRWGDGIIEDDQLILCDAQTSGGLLLSVASDKAEALISALAAKEVSGVMIGDVTAHTGAAVEVGP